MTPSAGAVRAPRTGAVAAALARDLPDLLGEDVRVRQLPGGHSWHTYEVAAADGRRAVVRVAPAGGTLDPYDPATEAAAMRSAGPDVPVPEVLACVPSPNGLGAPYAVHTWVDGRVVTLSAVTDEVERAAYRDALADMLGRVHAHGDPAGLGVVPDTVSDALAVELARTVAAFTRSATCRHPGLTVGLRWLRTRLPRCEQPPVLCHGDFRLHNLVWSAPGALAAVLDWERAWVGDPMADVAFTRRFSGWCAVEGPAVDVYERASGWGIDPTRVAYGARFEHVRSYSSATRGLRALAEARTDRLSLYAIGEAGLAGAWDLVELLGDGPLAPAPADGLAPDWRPPVPMDRIDALAGEADAAGQSRLAEHLRDHARQDAEARDRSLVALRAAPGTPRLRQALRVADPERAWADAYAVLAEAVVDGGPSLLPSLRALALRDTTRPTLRRTTMLVGGAP